MGTGAEARVMYGIDLDRLFEDRRLNARLAWALVAAMVALAGVELVRGEYALAGLTALVAGVALLPGPFYRSYQVTLPWEILAVVTAVLAWLAVDPTADAAFYMAMAAVSLLVAIELHLFTTVRMSHRFALAFVVVATSAFAAVWAVARWTSDVLLDTAFVSTHDVIMFEFAVATAAGVVAGIAFEAYVLWWEGHGDRLASLPGGDAS
jgi:hypothetical protein